MGAGGGGRTRGLSLPVGCGTGREGAFRGGWEVIEKDEAISFDTGAAGGYLALPQRICGSNSVVECNLAKVDVEGSNPFSRSAKS